MTYIIRKWLKKFDSYWLPILGLAIILMIAAWPVLHFLRTPTSLDGTVLYMQKNLLELQVDFTNLVGDQKLVERFVNQTYSGEDLKKVIDKEYTILLYENNQLVFWNNNEAVPPTSTWGNLSEGSHFIQLKNGYYQLVRKSVAITTVPSSTTTVTALALELLKYDYGDGNIYLKNEANPKFSFPASLKISKEVVPKSDKNYKVENPTKDSNIYIYHDKQILESQVSYLAILLQSIAIILFLVLLNKLAFFIYKRLGPLHSFVFLMVAFGVVRVLINYFHLPISSQELSFFKDITEKGLYLFNSIGEMAISLFFIMWLFIFLHKYIQPKISYDNVWMQKINQKTTAFLTHIFKDKIKEDKNIIQRTIFYVSLLSIIFLLTSGVYYAVECLIIDFSVVFGISKTAYIDARTILGLLCLGFLLVSFFFACQKIALLIEQLNLSYKVRFIGFLVTLLPYSWLFFSLVTFTPLHIVIIIWVLFYALLIDLFSPKNYHTITTRKLLFWVFFFSTFASFMVYIFGQQQEESHRTAFLNKVLNERDMVTEYQLDEVCRNIWKENAIMSKYYTNPFLPINELKERLKNKYIKDKFSNYNTDISILKPNDEKLRKYEIKVKLANENTDYTSLIRKTGKVYSVKLPFFGTNRSIGIGGGPIGYCLIEMELKDHKLRNVYPELTINDKFRTDELESQYSYAIYKDGILKKKSGKYPYNYIKDDSFRATDSIYKTLTRNNYAHLVYQTKLQTKAKTSEKTIVVSREDNSLFSILSLFSHLFCFAIFTMLIIIAINSLFKIGSTNLQVRYLMYSSLRKRINSTMILIVFFSFLLSGLMTIGYFYEGSTESHRKILIQKQEEIRLSIERYLKSKEADKIPKLKGIKKTEELEETVKALSEIHSMDINIYQINGKLLASSQTEIFDKGLKANIINADAFYAIARLAQSQFIQDEKIGTLSYLATYVPIKNDISQVVGYLNVPYFSQAKELRNEISNLLVALINVYVFLLLGGTVVTILLSNSIINPLKMLSERLEKVKLGEQNDLLYWKDKDEIGTLINQYNNMMIKLEESAKLLAKSERQYAWQEMARQVAHEIKNPLTPMKLSIQHLQRAYRDNRPNVGEMAQRVTRTLVEQIDTLSQIASEFSNFAKMPKPNNAIMDANEVLLNVIHLYEDTNMVNIYKVMPEEPCLIFADKKQLLRVFNNLVKNAIQAIPDEREGIIVVNVKRASDSIVIGVADNGTGISEDKREKVFVPNFTTKSSGMGLGLAMSKNIIEAAKGEIWFESEVGEGTTFFVMLPLADESSAQASVEETSQYST